PETPAPLHVSWEKPLSTYPHSTDFGSRTQLRPGSSLQVARPVARYTGRADLSYAGTTGARHSRAAQTSSTAAGATVPHAAEPGAAPTRREAGVPCTTLAVSRAAAAEIPDAAGSATTGHSRAAQTSSTAASTTVPRAAEP